MDRIIGRAALALLTLMAAGLVWRVADPSAADLIANLVYAAGGAFLAFTAAAITVSEIRAGFAARSGRPLRSVTRVR